MGLGNRPQMVFDLLGGRSVWLVGGSGFEGGGPFLSCPLTSWVSRPVSPWVGLLGSHTWIVALMFCVGEHSFFGDMWEWIGHLGGFAAFFLIYVHVLVVHMSHCQTLFNSAQLIFT